MRYLLLLGLVAFSAANDLKKDIPCDCPYTWNPVCGNDGRSYLNECRLNCVKRALKPDLEVAYEGVCSNHLQAAQAEEVVGLEVGCVCPYIWKPVCGNDGRTYTNRCDLNCAKRGKPDLELAYEGACKHLLQAAQAEEVEGLGSNHCECPRVLHRVCGSDGNTYSNPCILNCAKHEGNRNLEQVHEGPCDKYDHDFEDPCQCDEDGFEPICGNDGITYHNLCHLDCAAFTSSPGVKVEHEGECHAEIQENQQILKRCMCTKKYKPVCGSDGRTYSNLCVLHCHPRLLLAYYGKCRHYQQAVETEEVRNPCICFRNYDPMCGTDGKTYGNLCTLNCAAQTKVPGLKLLHKGRCAPKDVEQEIAGIELTTGVLLNKEQRKLNLALPYGRIIINNQK